MGVFLHDAHFPPHSVQVSSWCTSSSVWRSVLNAYYLFEDYFTLRMGDALEPKAVAKEVYKCGEDDATLPHRFDKVDGSKVRKHFS